MVLDAGRNGGFQVYWCPCRKMHWAERMGWFISYDFISQLEAALRSEAPTFLAMFLNVLGPVVPRVAGIVATTWPWWRLRYLPNQVSQGRSHGRQKM
jgi:hypothetical protein